MINETYINNQRNLNLQPLLGYSMPDGFRLLSSEISSWTFDGLIPKTVKDLLIWNRQTASINILPGYYGVLIFDDNTTSLRPIVSVTTDPDNLFIQNTIASVPTNLEEGGQITSYSRNGNIATYTVPNGLVQGNTVKVYGLSNSEFNFNSKVVLSATPTEFTVELNTSGTVEPQPGNNGVFFLLTSFISDFIIKYLDENNYEQELRQPVVLGSDGYPLNRMEVIYADWEDKVIGSSGWAIDSFGNSIFNNVAVRGLIEATSGNFSGNLTVNDGSMKIGANVFSKNQYQITKIQVASNELIITVLETPTLNVGDTIKIYGSNSLSVTTPTVLVGETSISGGGIDINGEYLVTNRNITNKKITVSFTSDNLAETTVTGNLEVKDYHSGIHINTNNYWYDNGLFSLGDALANVTWNPTTATLNITGDVTASKIRGSDVYGDSFQIGGNEFGWVGSAGDIFSGTASSTSYIKSGFYSNPITSFEQELNTDGTVKRTNANISGKISASTRSLYADVSNLSSPLKVGYQIKVGSEYLIVDQILSSSLIKLRSVPKTFYQNYSFTTYYTNTTLVSQFEIFTELPQQLDDTYLLSFEGPADLDYHAKNIPVELSANGKIYTTRSIPPVQTADGKPKTYTKDSLYASLSNVDSYRKLSNIKRIVASLSDIPGSYYNTKIFVDDSSIYSTGDVFYVENIPSYYSDLSSLNSSYFPIIEIGTDPIYGDFLFVFADGYLSFTGNELNQEFKSFATSSIEVLDNVVTVTINKGVNASDNPHYDVGQKITLIANNARIIDNKINIYNNIPQEKKYTSNPTITNIVEDSSSYKISYVEDLEDTIKTSISGTVSSYPTIDTKNWDNTYSLTIGSSNPDDAPFQIDQFGENVKIKNLEVTGDVTGFYYDIIELDDFSGAFDGKSNTFLPRYNQEKVVLDNPLRLVISLNGVVQSAFIKHKEYVWQTGFLGYKGYTLDDNGKIKFSESPPPGSTINARVLPGPTKNKKSRIYPFKSVDIALG